MKEQIETLLHTKWAGRELYYYESTGSTNEDAKERLINGASDGVLVVADTQTAGRGRRGREWQSPPDGNIYMSLGLRPKFSPDTAPMLTLVMAMAVAEAVEKTEQIQCMIKWPNDLVTHGKKLCGILTEMSLEKDRIDHVVIGVGINVNICDFPEEIQKTATSIYVEKGEKVLRAPLISAIMDGFERLYEIFMQTRDLSVLKEAYMKHLVNMNTLVRVLEPLGEYEGVAKGIDEKGQLLVEKTDGSVMTVYAGEVSVRGVYGYV